MNSSVHTWQAPVYIELEEPVETSKSKEKLAYSAPVMLPPETQVEPDLSPVEERQETPVVSPLTKGVTEPFSLPAWATDKIKVTVCEESESRSLKQPLLWLLAGLSAWLLLLLIVDAWWFLAAQFTASWFLGGIFTVLFLGISSAAGWLSLRAYRDLKTLHTVTALQTEGQRILEDNSYGQARHYLNKLARFYAHRSDLKKQLERFFLVVNNSHQDREMCELFSSQVLHSLDNQAYRIVVKRANETALLVALSPAALLSGLLTLWRTLRMVRDIATLYGGQPGFFTALSLWSAVIHNLLYAEVSEILAESAAETFGSSLLSIVSVHLAQGIGSSLMTARVGLKAIQACRPQPFLPEEKPSLKDIRREVLSSFKQLAGKSSVNPKA